VNAEGVFAKFNELIPLLQNVEASPEVTEGSRNTTVSTMELKAVSVVTSLSLLCTQVPDTRSHDWVQDSVE